VVAEIGAGRRIVGPVLLLAVRHAATGGCCIGLRIGTVSRRRRIAVIVVPVVINVGGSQCAANDGAGGKARAPAAPTAMPTTAPLHGLQRGRGCIPHRGGADRCRARGRRQHGSAGGHHRSGQNFGGQVHASSPLIFSTDGPPASTPASVVRRDPSRDVT